MASAKRVRNVTFTTGRVIKRTRTINAKANRFIAKKMTAALKKAIGRPGPPPSRRDAFLKIDSGDLHRGTKVIARGGTLVIRTLGYGLLHNRPQGIRGVRRKFIKEVIFDKRREWERMMNAKRRQLSKE